MCLRVLFVLFWEGNITSNIDFNNDGIYNPLLGDHPDIQGNLSTIPDQAIYIIRNDIGNIHTEVSGRPLYIVQDRVGFIKKNLL